MAAKRRPKRDPDVDFYSGTAGSFEKVEVWFKEEYLVSTLDDEKWAFRIQRWTSKESAMWSYLTLKEGYSRCPSIDWDVDFWRFGVAPNSLGSLIEKAYQDHLATESIEKAIKEAK